MVILCNLIIFLIHILVTKNEFVWESFSEDEIPAPTKTKFDTESKEGSEKNKPKTSETKITLFFSKK